ncbi:MAG: response regulator [Planctomycetota bacterium]
MAGEVGVASGSFHVVFIDQRMPGMDGVETARRIRQMPGSEKLSILAFAADDSDETRNKLIEAGMDGLVQHPAYNVLKGDGLIKYLPARK